MNNIKIELSKVSQVKFPHFYLINIFNKSNYFKHQIIFSLKIFDKKKNIIFNLFNTYLVPFLIMNFYYVLNYINDRASILVNNSNNTLILNFKI